MTFLLILLAIASVASVVQMVRSLTSDGYGHRPAPRSHHLDEFQELRPLDRV